MRVAVWTKWDFVHRLLSQSKIGRSSKSTRLLSGDDATTIDDAATESGKTASGVLAGSGDLVISHPAMRMFQVV
jgi:hypothetical protein